MANFIHRKNSQANFILERVHVAINNHLRFLRTIDPTQIMQDDDPWEIFECLCPSPLTQRFILHPK